MGRKGLWSYLFSLITFKAILEYQALEVFLVYMQYIDLCFIIAIATFLNLFFIHPSLSDLYSYLHNSGTFCLCLNDKFPSILFSLSSSFFLPQHRDLASLPCFLCVKELTCCTLDTCVHTLRLCMLKVNYFGYYKRFCSKGIGW